MWRHNGKMEIYEQVNGLSADTKSAGTLLLDSPASRLREINFFCLSHSACDIQLQQHEWTKTIGNFTLLTSCMSVSLVTHLCLTLCDPMDWSLPGSSVHGLLQARILEWLAIPFSRGSSRPRDWTWVSCIATHLQCGRVGFYSWVGKISWRRE